MRLQTCAAAMKYIFTSEFLKVQPPATSLGDAWELLYLDLLKAEYPAVDFERLLTTGARGGHPTPANIYRLSMQVG
jgi:hypothetical protein